MNKIDMIKIEIGVRFKVFREFIDRTVEQMAAELDIPISEINEIENGRIFPKIACLHYLFETYGLNINWVVSKIGSMFIKKDSLKPGKVYDTNPPVQPGDPRFDQYIELLELMEIPIIKDSIIAALLEIKTLLKKQSREKNKD